MQDNATALWLLCRRNSCNFSAGIFAAKCRNSTNGIFIGRYAGMGCNGATGAGNIILGNEAGKCSTTGANNVISGSYAAKCITTGGYNVIFGQQAAKCLTTGANNIFLGKYVACSGDITGNDNISLGKCSGLSLTSGGYNVFFGSCAGKLTAGASHNIFLGRCAGCTNTSGTANIAIGKDVVLPSATGDAQLAFGCGTNRWIAGDSSYNVTIAGIATVYAATGIVSATKFCGDGSALTGISGGGGLSYFTESENTSSPNNTVAANRLLATGSGTNIDAVFQPKGTGAFLAQLPDGTTAGGNKRGCYAVDLQMSRDNAACVAVDNYSVIGGGIITGLILILELFLVDVEIVLEAMHL